MITNSYQMKHTCHSKGCLRSHINRQCSPLWRQHRHVFAHANAHKGAECHPATLFQASCTCCCNTAIWTGSHCRTCEKLDGHIDLLLHMLGTMYRWCVAAFSSDLWNIPTLIDQVLGSHVGEDWRIVRAAVTARTASREEIRAHVAPAVWSTGLGFICNYIFLYLHR